MLFALAIGVAGASALVAQPTNDAPLPIQRIILPPERVAKELDKVPTGGMVLMPLADFDARLDRLRQWMNTREARPRLTSARYRAELIGDALQDGTAEWTLNHPGKAAALLPVEKFNLAIGKANWKGGDEVLFGELDGKSLGLMVPPGESQVCLFDWSARGTLTSDGLIFSLASPPCPLTTLDLTLPAEYWLSAAKGIAVSGPRPAGTKGKQIWQVQSTATKPIELTARKTTISKPGSLGLFAQVRAVEIFGAAAVEVEHVFQVDVVHGSIRELYLDGEDSMQPYEVSSKSGAIKTWTWSAPKKDAKAKPGPAAARILHIEFDAPVQGTLQDLRIRSLVARVPSVVWQSPSLRVRGAYPRGETLEVHLPADSMPGLWDHGSFHPVNLTTQANGRQVLTLAQSGPDAASKRPTLRFFEKEKEMTTREQVDWRLGPRGSNLTATIVYAPERGSYFTLTVKTPPIASGYAIEKLDLQPADSLRGWRFIGDLLVVELNQPLAIGKKATLTVQLAAQYREIMSGSRLLTLPEVTPMDSGKREGAAAVFVDPKLQAHLAASSLPLTTSQATPANPTERPSFGFHYRNQKLTATVRVSPQPLALSWSGQHTVMLDEQKTALQFRFVVTPQTGTTETLDFRTAPGFPAAWKIKAEEGAPAVHHWERLHSQETLPHLLSFGAVHPMQLLSLENLLPPGQRWRVHLAEPLSRKSGYLIEAEMPLGLREDALRRLSMQIPRPDALESLAGHLAASQVTEAASLRAAALPLITPTTFVHLEQAIAVQSRSEPLHKIEAPGFDMARPLSERNPFQLQLRQSEEKGLPTDRLLVWTRPEKRVRSALESCENAVVTTYVLDDGRIFHSVGFELWHWRDNEVKWPLPKGTRVVAVKILDRWLNRLFENDGSHLTLPYDSNLPSARYEILLRQESDPWPYFMKAPLPAVEWPVKPLGLRTRVSVQSGWSPLSTRGFAPVGVPAAIARRSNTMSILDRIWSYGQNWWQTSETADRQEKLDQQKQAVLSAEAQMRRAGAPKSLKLGEILDRFAAQHFKDAAPLVIDEVAMNSLRLSGATVVPAADVKPDAVRPFWERLGLVYVPMARAALLTSPARARALDIEEYGANDDCNNALLEAIVHGHDSSGGFFLVTSWLNLPPEPPVDTAPFPFQSQQGDGRSAQEWEVVTSESPAAIYLVHPPIARLLGLILALAAGLLAWRFHGLDSPLRSIRAHLVFGLMSVLAWIWMPEALGEYFAVPTMLVVLLSLAMLIARYARKTRGTAAATGETSTIKRATVGGAVAGALLVGVAWSFGQPIIERVHAVYIIEGKTPSVLVTPELIGKLDQMEANAKSGPRGTVILSADYQGHVRDALASFEVEYGLHNFQSEASLVLPLTGVQLQEGALLDGKAIFPTPHKNGYAVAIKGLGQHRLKLKFTARVGANGDRAELRFGIPKLPRSQVAVTWPTPVREIHCKRCLGAEKKDDDDKSSNTWFAQLGYESDLHLQWTAAPSAAKAIDVKEAHYWDLRAESVALRSSFHFLNPKGTLSQLSVALPEGMHVRSATVSATPAAGSASEVAVRDWQIVGKAGQRRAVVELAQPVAGSLVLNLDIVPPRLAPDQLVLALPAPLQANTVSGILGYRLDAAELRVTNQNLAVQSMTPAAFDQLWQNQSGSTIGPVTHAYSIQRKSLQAGLELTLQSSLPQVKGQLVWNLDLYYSELQATFTLTNPREDFMLLDFTIDPDMILMSVSGPDVHRWHALDGRVQIWLTQPRKTTSLTFSASRSAPVKGALPAKQIVAAPVLIPVRMRLADVELLVQPGPGLEVEPLTLKQLRRHPVDVRRYHVDAAPYAGSFNLVWRAPPAKATVLTKIQADQEKIEQQHLIRLITTRGRLPAVKLRVKNAGSSTFTLDAPGAVVGALKSQSNEPAWTITYPVGAPQEVFLAVRGQAGEASPAGALVAAIDLEGAEVDAAWLAWKDAELMSGKSAKKLTSQKKVKDRIAMVRNDRWSRDLELFSAAEATDELLAIPTKPPLQGSVRGSAIKQSARRSGAYWLHGAAVDFTLQEAVELRLQMPAAVDFMRARIDDQSTPIWSLTGREWVISVEPGARPRRIELRWTYAASTESDQTPDVRPLRIEQMENAVVARFVHVPAGDAIASPALPSKPPLLEQNLLAAEAHLHVAATLAADPSQLEANLPGIALEQQRFYAQIRQAEYVLAAWKLAAPDANWTRDAERLTDLKNKNAALARDLRYDDQRKLAEKSRVLSASGIVRDVSGDMGVSVLLPGDATTFRIESADARRLNSQRFATEWVLLVGVFLILMSNFRQALWVLGVLAPELGIALLITGFAVFGESLLGAAAILFLVAVRLVWLVRGIQWRFAIPASASTSSLPQAPHDIPSKH